jgi:hypothetical protein
MRTEQVAKLSSGGNRAISVHTNSIVNDKSVRLGSNAIIILVDDVLTTGNSIRACKSILMQRKDVVAVISIVLAKTMNRNYLSPQIKCMNNKSSDSSDMLFTQSHPDRPVYWGRRYSSISKTSKKPDTIQTITGNNTDYEMTYDVTKSNKTDTNKRAYQPRRETRLDPVQSLKSDFPFIDIEMAENRVQKGMTKEEINEYRKQTYIRISNDPYLPWIELILPTVLCGFIYLVYIRELLGEVTQTDLILACTIYSWTGFLYFLVLISIVSKYIASVLFSFRLYRLSLFLKTTSYKLAKLSSQISIFGIAIVTIIIIVYGIYQEFK